MSQAGTIDNSGRVAPNLDFSKLELIVKHWNDSDMYPRVPSNDEATLSGKARRRRLLKEEQKRRQFRASLAKKDTKKR